jgi:hypothetical protein
MKANSRSKFRSSHSTCPIVLAIAAVSASGDSAMKSSRTRRGATAFAGQRRRDFCRLLRRRLGRWLRWRLAWSRPRARDRHETVKMCFIIGIRNRDCTPSVGLGNCAGSGGSCLVCATARKRGESRTESRSISTS